MDRLISLQAAIDAIQRYKYEHGFAFHACTMGIERDIKALPSAQPEQECEKCIFRPFKQFQTEPQWIPCSETEDLPEHEVLCCDRYGEELIGWLSCEDDQWLCESDGEMMYDPIAWREKPEPWRGEEK